MSAAFLVFAILIVARFVLIAVVAVVALATTSSPRRRAALSVLQLLMVRHRWLARGSTIDAHVNPADE